MPTNRFAPSQVNSNRSNCEPHVAPGGRISSEGEQRLGTAQSEAAMSKTRAEPAMEEAMRIHSRVFEGHHTNPVSRGQLPKKPSASGTPAPRHKIGDSPRMALLSVTRTVLPAHAAKKEPVTLQATATIGPLKPTQSTADELTSRLNTRMVLSRHPAAKCFPSGDAAIHCTEAALRSSRMLSVSKAALSFVSESASPRLALKTRTPPYAATASDPPGVNIVAAIELCSSCLNLTFPSSAVTITARPAQKERR
mmetsp:Transcript_47639/g.87129  ORF Transcript_47639/g.87129 Transcript_47639/m.87129 type:complete len:252 (+) Transcript_47639:43-798(+)